MECSHFRSHTVSPRKSFVREQIRTKTELCTIWILSTTQK